MSKDSLKKTIDTICETVSFVDNFPSSKKSKLLEFSVEFCDNYGVAEQSISVVLEGREKENRNRELFIEVNGILAQTITYESEMSIAKTASASITTAVLAGGGAAAGPAGWIMAIATGGSYYALGHVIATATSKEAGEQAKIAAANLWDLYVINKRKVFDRIELNVPNTEEELFNLDLFKDLAKTLPKDVAVVITTTDNAKVEIKVGNTTTMSIYGSKIFNTNEDTKKMKEWIENTTSNSIEDLNKKDLTIKQEKILEEKLNNFETFSKAFMEDTEPKEDIDKLQEKIQEIKAKDNFNEKIKELQELDFKEFTSNDYIQMQFTRYKDRIIEESTNIEEKTANTQQYKAYDYIQPNTNTIENRPSVQMMD